MINIVLFEPEIPPNTGNIIRLAANTGSQLHLIKPFGFDLEDKKLRRAGLDYREYAGVCVYENWLEFSKSNGNYRFFGITTKGNCCYSDVQYRDEDFLIFGPETRGLPESVRNELDRMHLLRIPMLPDNRSLNLSNAVALIVYEAWRQLGFAQGS